MVKLTQEGVEAQEKGQRIPRFHFEKFHDSGEGSNFYMDLKFIKVYQEGTQKWLIHPFWPRFISKIFIGSHVLGLSIEGGQGHSTPSFIPPSEVSPFS